MGQSRKIALTVNGKRYEEEVEVRVTLADFIRHQLGLTGTHLGCEHGVCGACTILMDGLSARSCLMLAVQADGHDILTVEGISMGVNYGCNKVRFPSPVKVGSKLRLGAAVASVESVGPDAAQAVLDITIETEGSEKPSCVAQVVYRYSW